MPSPILSSEVIEPAAEALIREHGDKALSEAALQVSALNSKGYYSLATTWQQIRHKIVERQQQDSRTPSKQRARELAAPRMVRQASAARPR